MINWIETEYGYIASIGLVTIGVDDLYLGGWRPFISYQSIEYGEETESLEKAKVEAIRMVKKLGVRLRNSANEILQSFENI